LVEKRYERFSEGLAAAAALLVFGWVAALAMSGAAVPSDLAIRNTIHAFASPTLTEVMRAVTQLGSSPFLVVLGAILVWRLIAAGRRRAALVLVAASLGGEAFDQVLKLVFRRPRPETFFGFIAPSGYSFPSGHAIASICFWGVVAAIAAARMQSPYARAAMWLSAALLAVWIGLSRIYLGAHYPSDVLGGYAAAVVWVMVIRTGYRAWLRRGVAGRSAGQGKETAGAPW
jgi:undecaprenyl-diphosphatase